MTFTLINPQIMYKLCCFDSVSNYWHQQYEVSTKLKAVLSTESEALTKSMKISIKFESRAPWILLLTLHIACNVLLPALKPSFRSPSVRSVILSIRFFSNLLNTFPSVSSKKNQSIDRG